MGREWLNEITIDWQKLNMAADSLEDKVGPANTDVEGLLKNINMFSRMALG